MLYATLHFNATPTTHGSITGGTGAFRNATGTVVGTSNAADTRAAITITYRS
ncbi:MAG TPA: hypothetical protein VME70_08225 [Mycobacteriales bacterium]|nr:hypothetical protein [Mycobacteriales bacterium]